MNSAIPTLRFYRFRQSGVGPNGEPTFQVTPTLLVFCAIAAILFPTEKPDRRMLNESIFRGAAISNRRGAIIVMNYPVFMSDELSSLSARSRFRAGMILAMAADALQLFVFPLFSEGALSPADDVLDVAVAIILVRLLGWHWEFLPAFAAELIPGADLIPFWTLSVVSVYRKWKQIAKAEDTDREARPALPSPPKII
jgi:hypothetical protein